MRLPVIFIKLRIDKILVPSFFAVYYLFYPIYMKDTYVWNQKFSFYLFNFLISCWFIFFYQYLHREIEVNERKWDKYKQSTSQNREKLIYIYRENESLIYMNGKKLGSMKMFWVLSLKNTISKKNKTSFLRPGQVDFFSSAF